MMKQDMAWANPGIERRLQSSIVAMEVIELPTESPTPLLHWHLAYTTATMRVHAGRASALEPKICINPAIFTTKMKTTYFN